MQEPYLDGLRESGFYMNNKFEIKTLISEKVFEEIFNEYYDSLCSYLNAFTQDQDTIQEIVQEVFIKLWKNRENYQISDIKHYLFRATRNQALNHFRNIKAESHKLEEWVEYKKKSKEGRERIDIEKNLDLMQKAIETLPPKCREILILCKLSGWSYNEVAKHLNISTKTVENQMGIAIKKLKELLLQ